MVCMVVHGGWHSSLELLHVDLDRFLQDALVSVSCVWSLNISGFLIYFTFYILHYISIYSKAGFM